MNQANSNDATKFEGTPINDEPVNVEGRGEKRAAEDNGAGHIKWAKDGISDDSIANPVKALNDKRPGTLYECIGMKGPAHSPTFTMQVTIGDHVIKAEGINKKKAKMMVAKAALQYLSECNVAEEALLASRVYQNPTNILNEIRPQSKYELLEEVTEGDLHYVRMKVTVDGEEFEAKAQSRQQVKSYAAMYALQKIFNLEFTVSEVDQMPTFYGDEQEWRKFQPEKNPVQQMYKLYRPLNCVVIEVDSPNQEDAKFKCTVTIENVVFNSTGATRQEAKYKACADSLEYLKQQGLLEWKLAEAASAKNQKIEKHNLRKQEEESAIEEFGLFEDQNPLQLMHDMYRPLDHEFVEVYTPNQEDVNFKCTLKIDEDVVFNVTESSQLKAKYRACLDALQYLKQLGVLEQKLADAAAAKAQRMAAHRARRKPASAQESQSS